MVVVMKVLLAEMELRYRELRSDSGGVAESCLPSWVVIMLLMDDRKPFHLLLKR